MVFGQAHQFLPTFRKNGIEDTVYAGKHCRMNAFRGDVANRGKGTLLVRM
jgi:formylmethanofuran dehydrogenase subunit C